MAEDLVSITEQKVNDISLQLQKWKYHSPKLDHGKLGMKPEGKKEINAIFLQSRDTKYNISTLMDLK